MIFTETKLKGAFLIDLELLEDDRGFFARSWCEREFKSRGIETVWVQCNISFNKMKGTLRGMHYQLPPYEEEKLVRCTMGSMYDVILDLRPNSETYKRWDSFYITAENRKAVYIPKGFAHGFISIVDNTEVSYQMSEYYVPKYSVGIRWNDPLFGIVWPGEVRVISDKDNGYANFSIR